MLDECERLLVLGFGVEQLVDAADPCITLVSSPLLISFSLRSINCTLMRRSLKKRWAFLVSNDFLVPKI